MARALLIVSSELVTPRRWNIRRAVSYLGLDPAFKVRTDEDMNLVMAVWKERTVLARKTNNDEEAKTLSLCKELVKRWYNCRTSRKCPKCGEAKSTHAYECRRCSYFTRHHSHSMSETTVKDYEIVATALVTPRNHITGELTLALRQLVDGQVGDSFVTPKQPTSIKLQAKMLGLEVMCRIANPAERDPKKRKYRVWRSDGLEDTKVNEIIQKRMKGEPVPKPKDCVPLPLDQRPDKHKKRH
jgi:hypothetical protein